MCVRVCVSERERVRVSVCVKERGRNSVWEREEGIVCVSGCVSECKEMTECVYVSK